jgi:hypothetical protein
MQESFYGERRRGEILGRGLEESKLMIVARGSAQWEKHVDMVMRVLIP